MSSSDWEDDRQQKREGRKNLLVRIYETALDWAKPHSGSLNKKPIPSPFLMKGLTDR